MSLVTVPVAQVNHLQLLCAWRKCTADRVSGSPYCEKHRPGFRLVLSPEKRVVYFVQCRNARGLIKIGKSSCWKKRWNGMTTDCPYPLTLLTLVYLDHARQMDVLERTLHKYLAEHRVQGEWFKPVAPVLKIVELAKSVPTPEFCALVGLDMRITSR